MDSSNPFLREKHPVYYPSNSRGSASRRRGNSEDETDPPSRETALQASKQDPGFDEYEVRDALLGVLSEIPSSAITSTLLSLATRQSVALPSVIREAWSPGQEPPTWLSRSMDRVFIRRRGQITRVHVACEPCNKAKRKCEALTNSRFCKHCTRMKREQECKFPSASRGAGSCSQSQASTSDVNQVPLHPTQADEMVTQFCDLTDDAGLNDPQTQVLASPPIEDTCPRPRALIEVADQREIHQTALAKEADNTEDEVEASHIEVSDRPDVEWIDRPGSSRISEWEAFI